MGDVPFTITERNLYIWLNLIYVPRCVSRGCRPRSGKKMYISFFKTMLSCTYFWSTMSTKLHLFKKKQKKTKKKQTQEQKQTHGLHHRSLEINVSIARFCPRNALPPPPKIKPAHIPSSPYPTIFSPETKEGFKGLLCNLKKPQPTISRLS